MSKFQLTDATIALICPQVNRWPTSGGEVAWQRMRDAVTSMHSLARALEAQCSSVETDPDLNPGAVNRRLADLGRKAIEELSTFAPMQKAEKAVKNNFELLNDKMEVLPSAPQNAVDALVLQEIRRHIGQQKSPVDFVIKNMGDARLVAAVLSCPPYLSGLSQAEYDLVGGRCRESLYPEQTQMKASLEKGMAELNESVSTARRLILDRCNCVEGSDGIVRGRHEAPPKPQLTKSAAPRDTQLSLVGGGEA